MIGIIVATADEARPLLARLGARASDDSPFPAYFASADSFPGDDALLLVCGMGNQRAAAGSDWLLTNHPVCRIVHAGICGSLKDHFRPGTVFSMHRAIDLRGGTPRTHRCDASVCPALPTACLVTWHEPVFDNSLRARLAAAGGDLVDMEGAVIAARAGRQSLPCTIVKGVTDYARKGERPLLHSNLERVAARVAEATINAIRISTMEQRQP